MLEVSVYGERVATKPLTTLELLLLDQSVVLVNINTPANWYSLGGAINFVVKL